MMASEDNGQGSDDVREVPSNAFAGVLVQRSNSWGDDYHGVYSVTPLTPEQMAEANREVNDAD